MPNPHIYYNHIMLTVAIQAGGTSRRMGQDKALSPFLGQPLIQHVVNRLSSLAAEIMVTTNQPQAYSFLSLPLYLDLIPGRGAAGWHLHCATFRQPPVRCCRRLRYALCQPCTLLC